MYYYNEIHKAVNASEATSANEKDSVNKSTYRRSLFSFRKGDFILKSQKKTA